MAGKSDLGIDCTVLDRTAVLYASNLGNASSHTCDNLPILLAGGGFRHQGHVAYDRRNHQVGQRVMSDLRLALFRAVQRQPLSFFTGTPACDPAAARWPR